MCGSPMTSVLQFPETVAQNRLDEETVGSLRDAHADTEVELPALAEINIDGGDEHLLCLPDRVPTVPRAIRAVILQAERDALQDVVRELHVRRELEAVALAGTVEGLIERRIKADVELVDLLVD